MVMRVHRLWATPARPSSVHEIQRRLHEHSVPIPAILQTRTGSTWPGLYDRLVEVTQYLPNHGEADMWDRMEAALTMPQARPSTAVGISPFTRNSPAS